jgi:hypothetical protein
MNEKIKNYAETLEQEQARIADKLRESLQNLGYRLRKVSIDEGQGIVNRNGLPCRATVSVCIFADEITEDGE